MKNCVRRTIGQAPVETRTCGLCLKRIPNEIMAMREHLIYEHEFEELKRELHITEFEYSKLLEGFTTTAKYN